MSDESDPVLLSFPRPYGLPAPRRALLVTSYMTGSTEGRNLGTAGYSYDFVARLFQPLLARWGQVTTIENTPARLKAAVDQAKQSGLEPVHISFLPFQDVVLADDAPNIVVPAWEFPDIPDHTFDNNPRNNWVEIANRCDLILVGGPFTEQTFQRAGIRTPIRVVPVPTAGDYFELPPWQAAVPRSVACPAYVFPQAAAAKLPLPQLGQPKRAGLLKRAGKGIERAVRHSFRAVFGRSFYRTLTQPFRSLQKKWRKAGARSRRPAAPILLPFARSAQLDLSGVVFTSIFNPDDGRKNWTDLITGYLAALGECEDATLVLKLITRRRQAVEKVVHYYLNRDMPHRCKLAVVCDFLSDEQMGQLCAASTYYAHTTRAEGNCLPLMNYLAAGRPGISPLHSAMTDYFDESLGFAVASHPEPAAWPHDRRLRLRTTWGRLVWPSLVEQFRQGYELAKNSAAEYAQLSQRCRERLEGWASNYAVACRLNEALGELFAAHETAQDGSQERAPLKQQTQAA